MRSDAATVDQYLDDLPDDRRDAIAAVRDVVNAHLPDGYEEVMKWGMITWQIPWPDYPDADNKQPLPLAGLASQKQYMSVYVPNVDAAEEAWFREQYAAADKPLDMGKSCVRFKRLDDVLLDVVGEAIERVPRPS